MADLDAARRYAQAAFDIANAGNAIDLWRSDLADVAQVLTDSQVASVFADARIPLDQRLAMLDRVLDVQPLVLNLARLLVQKGRSLDAAAVAAAFGQMADEQQNIAHAQITTAVPLDASQVANIETQLSTSLGKRVRATAVVDPAILGGVLVRVGDKLIDGSVRSRLRRLRRDLEGVR